MNIKQVMRNYTGGRDGANFDGRILSQPWQSHYYLFREQGYLYDEEVYVFWLMDKEEVDSVNELDMLNWDDPDWIENEDGEVIAGECPWK